MKKMIMSITILMLFLVSCSTPTHETEESVSMEETYKPEDEMYVHEYDRTFYIKNYARLTDEQLDRFKKDIYDAVLYLEERFHDRIDEKKYYISVDVGYKASNADGNSIHYYRYLEGRAGIIHELTHAMLGYQFGGYFTQEGLAVYIQNKYGEFGYPSSDISIHSLMSYFKENNKYIPLETLMNEELVSNFGGKYANEVLQWMAYTEAGSFTEYLIDEYGLEMFMQLYNQPELASKVEEVYKKPLSQLEEEWLNFIKKQSTEEVAKLFEIPYLKDINERLLKSNIHELINTYDWSS
ncbi:hypothetical protein [Bacillus solimangrovi]|uniref:Peptidase MA-like domain-containing protein n=1 Tax=Bacillus solimangrovi TaxID=1305675 RepID=A0A1E5LJD3_9BACI|nr:hypothetical protein [Bacillus solimangrovi]OEH94185.1 hypothetical protein BFG57_09035 [Bacillus solimangrovi]